MTAGEVVIYINSPVKFHAGKWSESGHHLRQLRSAITKSKISAVLPETHPFRKSYRRLRCDSGGGCNLHKYTGQTLNIELILTKPHHTARITIQKTAPACPAKICWCSYMLVFICVYRTNIFKHVFLKCL